VSSQRNEFKEYDHLLTVEEKAGETHDEKIDLPQRTQILAQFEGTWKILIIG
jgi:hypothetical protein